ncbi:L-lactate permease [Bradyrhizobium sp. USDA 4461]
MIAICCAVIPIAAVLGLIASRRVTVFSAGLIGCSIAVGEALVGLLPQKLEMLQLWSETLQGSWIAWQSAAVLVCGYFFYDVIRRGDAGAPALATRKLSHRGLWSICFLLGPIAESVTGFGVGAIIAMPAILALGVTGSDAVLLALFSQILVPWGALSVGTITAAALSHQSPQELAFATAILTAPLLGGYLLVFWSLVTSSGRLISTRQKLVDVAWTAALGAAIVLGAPCIPVELGVIVPAGLVLLTHWGCYERPRIAQASLLLRRLMPYATVIALLIITRSMPPIRSLLSGALEFKPFPELPSFAPLYNPSFWLLVAGTGNLVAIGRSTEWSSVLTEAVKRTWRPIASITLFVCLAQVLSATGGAELLGSSLKSLLGSHAQLVAPLIGGLGGFLVGSNSASTAMMMPVQVALGVQNSLWPAAIQNVSASNFTLLSPPRIGLATALVHSSLSESDVYRKAWPVALTMISILTAEAAILMSWSGDALF